MKKNYYAVAWLLFFILCVGCKENKGTTVLPTKVKVEKAEMQPISGTQGLSGTVEAESGSALSFPVGGTVTRIAVSSGQMVAKGALLAEVDATTMRNAHSATLALRTQAEDAYRRMKQLHDNGSLPEIQWAEVQSKLQQAVAAEQIAKKSMADCKLYAPFSGFVSEKSVEMGQNVLPGMPVVKLVRIAQVKIKLAVPENEIAKIKKGQPVRVQVSALGDKIFRGTVIEKGVSADALSRSYEVNVLIDNKDRALLPGMICQAYLEQGDTQTGIVLANQTILLDDQSQPFVWINAGGKAQKRRIKTGALTTRGVVIANGLSAGEEVIVTGQQKVSENMPIEPIK